MVVTTTVLEDTGFEPPFFYLRNKYKIYIITINRVIDKEDMNGYFFSEELLHLFAVVTLRR